MTSTLREYFYKLRGKSIAVKCELQQLCATVLQCNLSYKYHFVKTTGELVTASANNQTEVNIIDIRYGSVAKIGTLLIADSQTINFILGTSETNARLVDNHFCYELNLGSLLTNYGLNICEFPFSSQFFQLDIRGDPQTEDYLYLQALHELTTNSKYWTEISADIAYRLFFGKTSFTSWLARNEESGRCKGLYPLIKPFVSKFLSTQKIEYLQLFGWWAANANTKWAVPLQNGITKYNVYYTVSLSPLALYRWNQLILSL